MTVRYAGWGDQVFLLETDPPHAPARQLLWGDFLDVVEELDGGTMLKVRFGRDAQGRPRHWLIPRAQTESARPLEVVFLDVGQGDGCLLAVPGGDGRERLLLVDGGEGDNLLRYISRRFNLKGQTNPVRFHAAVATHPDQDHYRGLQGLLDHPKLHFERLYHNGVGERAGPDPFGPRDASRRFLADPIVTHEQAAALWGGNVSHGRKLYPQLMRTALSSGRVGEVRSLSTGSAEMHAGRAWMPGFSPASNASCQIEVLGPVLEHDAAGAPRLRIFGDRIGSKAFNPGKTKNGHSVLLRLTCGAFTLLLGGDLNRPAEDFLLRHHSGIAAGQALADAVPPARQRFGCDVLKCCHHGSADVTDEFLDATQPLAFVISSGDAEGHVHPRPELLGRLGRHGRGEQPLLLATELQRSTREREDPKLLSRITALNAAIEAATAAGGDAASDKAERETLLKTLARRNVEVYGAIKLRSDGQRMLLAFEIEEQTPTDRWHAYRFEHRQGQGFVPVDG